VPTLSPVPTRATPIRIISGRHSSKLIDTIWHCCHLVFVLCRYLRRKFEGKLASCTRVEKEDLDKKNHLVGLTQTYLKLCFSNVQDLLTVRAKLSPIVNKNKVQAKDGAYADDTFAVSTPASQSDGHSARRAVQDVADFLLDLREYDVP
jgi:DNA polymerase epsilon subunit 1